MRVLLIDDDPEIRFLAGYVLEQAGHQVTAVESGAEGIRAAAADPFDVVLLDYRLGDIGGDVVLEALLQASPDRPVVFLTGRDDAATIDSLRAAGAADVITKPFDPESLAARVATAAGGDGGTGPGSAGR